jgi:cellulose biosynthesis protein BcsQ
MKHIEVSASKGGVGTTTLSTCLAIGLAKRGKKVLLVDLSKHGDCFAVTGVPQSSGIVDGYTDGMSIVHVDARSLPSDVDKSFDHIIYDAGVNGLQNYAVADDIYRLAVAPNAYTALRNMTKTANDYHGLVTVVTDGNALNAKDVENVLRLRALAEMPIKPEISRAIDAGMLTMRYDDVIASWIAPLIKEMAKTKVSA